MGRDDRTIIDSVADRQVWAREVAAQMRDLPDREATALRLIYAHGLSSREAAGWLSMDVDVFHHLVAQGLQRLGVAIIEDPVEQLLAEHPPVRRGSSISGPAKLITASIEPVAPVVAADGPQDSIASFESMHRPSRRSAPAWRV